MHDPSAVAFVIDPTIFTTEKARVRVATEGIAQGQAIAVGEPQGDQWDAWRDIPPADVCREVDAERLLNLFETTLTRG